MEIETPEWKISSKIWRKKRITRVEMNRALKGASKVITDTHTKQNFYQAGSSVTLDKEFYYGDTLSSKEIELRAEEMFFARSSKERGGL